MPLKLSRALSHSSSNSVVSLGFGLLALTITGCAAAASPARSARAEVPQVRVEAHREAPRESAAMAYDSAAARAKETREEVPPMLYPPEVVHEARIEMAREALDADNQAKAEIEEVEQMRRDIAEAPIGTGSIRHGSRPQ